jgi:hypothetical protein
VAAAAEQSWSVDKGTGRKAGTRSTLLYSAGEAVPVSGLAPILRKKLKPGTAALPHDKVIPIRSFQDDLMHKLELRQVMPKRGDDTKTAEAGPLDPEDLAPGDQFTKEDANYRMAAAPSRACGQCRHFVGPGACELVAGLIRAIDTCDLFEPVDDGRQSGVVQATFVPDEVAEAEQDDFGDDGGDGLDGAASDCADEDRDAAGRCPDDPDFDTFTMGQWGQATERGEDPGLPFGGGGDAVVQSEVSPPGWSGTVKAMKKHPEIGKPFALAWWAKQRGEKPHYPPEKTVQAELAEAGKVIVLAEAYVGFGKLQKSLAGRKGVRDPGAVAATIGRAKYGKGPFQRAAAKGKSMRGRANEGLP